MNNEIYKKLKNDYDYKRNIELEEAKNKKEEIYKKLPKLCELEDQKNKLAIETNKIILTSDNITKQIKLENFQTEIGKIDNKIEKVLKDNGYSKADFEPKYVCKLCKDTGVVKIDGKIKYCSCFLQKLINISYKQSNITKLNEENFETFDTGYYSNKKDKNKYGIDISPLENIEKIRKISENFCKNIDLNNQKNLLFTGNTGLGKTFLTNCIANEVIKSYHTVVYQTAPMLMDMIINYKYSYNKENYAKEEYNRIFDVDLLIIDDLGTEIMNENRFTELFNIINTRLLKNKKMVISTNLTLKDLYNEYDERVISRLIGDFILCKFIGDDIRLKKKKISC